MPNPNTIRYSTATQSGALRKGSFYLGVTDRDYGPTENTGYFNGVTFSSGYLSYIWDGSQIRYNEVSNDSQLISFLSSQSGTNFSTLTASLLWSVTQSTILVSDRQYENIITDGLVLNVDGFASSYPRAGTTWYDLSPQQNNVLLQGTLGSNIIYGTERFGSMTFSGNAWGRIGPTSSNFIRGFEVGPHWDLNWTLDFWIKSPLSRIGAVLGARTATNGTFGLQIFITAVNSGWTYCQINRVVNVFSVFFQPVINNAVNKWTHFSFTSNDAFTYSIYVNGGLMNTTATNWRDNAARVSATATNPYLISTDNTNWQDGEYTSYKIYNRCLSAQEVRQNYRSTFFNRFYNTNVVSDGMVLLLDAGYGGSFGTQSTSWFDISGFGRNGTLTNGPTFSSNNGGSIVFDGVNDYVELGSLSLTMSLPFTLSFWIYATTTTALYPNICTFRTNLGVPFELSLSDQTNYRGIVFGSPQTVRRRTNLALSNYLDRWFNVTLVYLGGNYLDNNNFILYDNGATASLVDAGSFASITQVYRIAGNSTTNYFKGNISTFIQYDRALSQSEVLSNFNAQKSRFGL